MTKEMTLHQCLANIKADELGREIALQDIVDTGIALVKKNIDECYVVVRYDKKAKGYAVTYDPFMEGGIIEKVIAIYSNEQPASDISISEPGKDGLKTKPKQQRSRKGKGGA